VGDDAALTSRKLFTRTFLAGKSLDALLVGTKTSTASGALRVVPPRPEIAFSKLCSCGLGKTCLAYILLGGRAYLGKIVIGLRIYPCSSADDPTKIRDNQSPSSSQRLASRRFPMPLTRRSILRTGTVAAISPLFGQAPLPATPARAQNSEPQWRHGL